jgi:hypothetical protein
MQIDITQTSIVKGVFLLFLAISGNFIAELLGCRTQKLLTSNMYVKHSIAFLILFFSLGFLSTESPVNPLTTFVNSLIIYITFLMFTKMDIIFTFLAIGLLMLMYILNMYSNYYEELGKKENDSKLKEKSKSLTKSTNIISGMTGLLIIIGFSLYCFKQSEEKENFSLLKLIFGKVECS